MESGRWVGAKTYHIARLVLRRKEIEKVVTSASRKHLQEYARYYYIIRFLGPFEYLRMLPIKSPCVPRGNNAIFTKTFRVSLAWVSGRGQSLRKEIGYRSGGDGEGGV